LVAASLFAFALPACRSELAGISQKRDGMCVTPSLRGAKKSTEKVKAEIKDCRDLFLDISRFTPDLEESEAPEKAIIEQCITVDSRLECWQVEENVFGTQRAMTLDPSANDHIGTYRYTEFRAGVRDSDGGYPIVAASERSLQEAVDHALKICREQKGDK